MELVVGDRCKGAGRPLSSLLEPFILVPWVVRSILALRPESVRGWFMMEVRAVALLHLCLRFLTAAIMRIRSPTLTMPISLRVI